MYLHYSLSFFVYLHKTVTIVNMCQPAVWALSCVLASHVVSGGLSDAHTHSPARTHTRIAKEGEGAHEEERERGRAVFFAVYKVFVLFVSSTYGIFIRVCVCVCVCVSLFVCVCEFVCFKYRAHKIYTCVCLTSRVWGAGLPPAYGQMN